MAKSDTPKVIVSVTAAPLPARCFSFALAPACHQLLHGLSVLSRGRAYFLRPGERLQPKVSGSLCSLLSCCWSLSPELYWETESGQAL